MESRKNSPKTTKIILIDPDGNYIGAVKGRLVKVKFADAGGEQVFLTEAEVTE